MGSKNLYTEERLAIPTKHFISYLVQELLIGIPSEVSCLENKNNEVINIYDFACRRSA